jgi:hypothetical protein
VPFECRKHQLIFPNRSAEKDGHFSKLRWRCLGHQIRYLSVQRPIDDDAESALAWVMLGNEKHGAPEIRIEHTRMSDQQRTNKTSRGWLLFKIAHLKTRNCDMRFRKLGSATMSRRGEAKHVLKMTKEIPMTNAE